MVGLSGHTLSGRVDLGPILGPSSGLFLSLQEGRKEGLSGVESVSWMNFGYVQPIWLRAYWRKIARFSELQFYSTFLWFTIAGKRRA